MEEILQSLQGLQRKAARLEREVSRLKAEKAEVEQRLLDMEARLQTQQEAYEDLSQHYEAAKVVGTLGKTEDREALKAQIDLYLKEIDICLNNFGE